MKKNSHAFVNQLLVCLLVSIGTSGSVGLGTVWIRHQNSMLANSNSALDARIKDVERHISEYKTLVATEQRPENLRQLNAQFRLGLVPMSEIPVVNVTEDPIQRMYARASRSGFGEMSVPPTVKLTAQR